jgi:hypothetical protein
VAAEVEGLIGRLGAKEASRQLYMSLDLVPPPTQEQLAQALQSVVVVRITPEHVLYLKARSASKENEYVEQPVH